MFPKSLYMLHIHFGKRVKFVQKPGHEDALYNKFVFLKGSVDQYLRYSTLKN